MNRSLRLRPGHNRLRTGAVVGLLLVTAVWGATFLVVKDATVGMPVFSFLTWRFAIAAVVMAAFRPSVVRRLDRGTLGRGAAAGFLLGVAFILQTLGLQHTSAAVSGFLTGLFVVLTPLLAWLLFRQRLSPLTWTAALTATAGLALITLSGASFGSGEALTLLCAVCFALHLLALGRWSPGRDAYAFTVVQLATAALMCLIGTVPHGVRIPHGAGAWTAVLVTAVLASAFAYMVQTWAQKHVTATQAAVILTMEPVFAGLFAVLAGGERLTLSTLAGGALVVTAMFLVEVPGSTSGTSAADEPSAGSGAARPQGGEAQSNPQLWAKETS
ncbi:MAG: DMT family transporter [Streptomyces sp.]|uniref:DMT family transporter n=1 Tax=Streptomyces sp. TaxID=1931 RepID=UPI0025FCDEB0|nr:DMT family transporter [Streptomyces sp.]MBW8800606.1 DMT family transporter [Streptomyces sp.]